MNDIRMAVLPHLTYDELTVVLSALMGQSRADQELLGVAQADPIREIALERLAITRSLITAASEARHQVLRPRGGPLEVLRVIFEQPDALTPAWWGAGEAVTPPS